MGRRSKDEDPFDRLSLDDRFVQGAPVELSAEQREAKRRRERLARELEEGQRVAALAKRSATRRRRRRRIPIALVVLLIGSLVVWRQVSEPVGDAAGRARVGDGKRADQLTIDGGVGEWPPPSPAQSKVPLGAPRPVTAPSEPFTYEAVQEGTTRPVAYDPCRPIHIVVNARTAPPAGAALLSEALLAINDATGLQFRMDGPSTETPVEPRSSYQQDRYPDRWAPVLVAWSDPRETPRLEGHISGIAGSHPVPVDRRNDKVRVYVTGGVTLDGPQLAQILTEPNGHALARSVIQHELGHLVGLDHVDDPTQLMNPVGSRDVVAFGQGDLTGLAKLGQGDCFPAI